MILHLSHELPRHATPRHDTMEVPVVVKHGANRHKLEIALEGEDAAENFKLQLYSLTGVEPSRQKIMVKGGVLKDGADMTKLGIKENHTFMMMGTAGELLKEPVEKHKFLEDMSDEQQAQVTKYPSGLVNLGNTCYMNSTLQTLRAIPELRDGLLEYSAPAAPANSLLAAQGPSLTTALRDLYQSMSNTTREYTPLAFLTVLRNQFPQFAERGRDGMYKQQDAEECWSQIMQTLKMSLGGRKDTDDAAFVDQYLLGQFATTMTCDDSPDEPAVESTETFIKLDCHISIKTNFMRDGLLAALEEKIEKQSAVLGRQATFTKSSRISRLPKYLTVHFVRFFWRRDVNKKTKIMRKVGFPFEFDATELCTDSLRKMTIPVRDKLRDLKKEQGERERAAKRAKSNDDTSPEINAPDVSAELEKVMNPEVAKDKSCNKSGLYGLKAIITHQGASAEGGHYRAWVKEEEKKDTWWKFNDDQVSQVTQDRIETLAGGGESDSALVLLYSAVSY